MYFPHSNLPLPFPHTLARLDFLLVRAAKFVSHLKLWGACLLVVVKVGLCSCCNNDCRGHGLRNGALHPRCRLRFSFYSRGRVGTLLTYLQYSQNAFLCISSTPIPSSPGSRKLSSQPERPEMAVPVGTFPAPLLPVCGKGFYRAHRVTALSLKSSMSHTNHCAHEV